MPSVFLLAIAGWTHENAFREAALELEGSARTAREHAARVIETNEVIAETIFNFVGSASDDAIRAGERDLHDRLGRITANLTQLQSVWIWGADGRPLVSNRFYPVPRELNVSEREFFKVPAEGGARLYVSQPLVARLTKEEFFDVAFRRTRPDGSFAGVISVSLFPRHFADFYSQLGMDARGALYSLFREDGMLLAAWPVRREPGTRLPAQNPVVQAIRGGAEAGVLRTSVSIEGEKRSVAFLKLPRYPLYVAAARSHDAILEEWRRNVGVLAGITVPLALLLMLVCWIALRRTRRELEMSRELAAQVEQRARAEQALAQSQKLEALGRVTGGVAHDFNNLLMVVRNNATLVKMLSKQPELEPIAAAIERATESGSKLTRQLLAFSRSQALDPEVIGFQEELESLKTLLRPALRSRITLDATVDADARPVKVDRGELELALLNLALNAADAMPEGGTVSLRVRNAHGTEIPELAGEFVCLSMTDSGVGIPADTMGRVFEPFFTTKERGKGTGLGLSQVYGFCRQSGGTARIDSREAAGTTVSLYLPVSAERPVEKTPAPEAASVAGLRVLLVEDNPEVTSATVSILRALGCHAAEESSGDAALARLQAEAASFDLVLSDIVMPGKLSGIDLAGVIRARFPALKVVLMTGYSDQLQRRQGTEAVLRKPFGKHELVRALLRAA